MISKKASKDKKALEEEHIWVPYALRGRVAQLRSRAEGRVLHIGTDDADTALSGTGATGENGVADGPAKTAASPARYDTICSVGALAMSKNLPRLAEELRDHLAADGKLLFLEPEAREVNPDITMTLWNSGFSVLQVERFSVPGTAPAGSRFWRKGHRTIWHNCLSGVARRKLEDWQEAARDEIAEAEPEEALQSGIKEGERVKQAANASKEAKEVRP